MQIAGCSTSTTWHCARRSHCSQCLQGDGRFFISNSKDQSIKLWDVRSMMSAHNYANMPAGSSMSLNWCACLPPAADALALLCRLPSLQAQRCPVCHLDSPPSECLPPSYMASVPLAALCPQQQKFSKFTPLLQHAWCAPTAAAPCPACAQRPSTSSPMLHSVPIAESRRCSITRAGHL